MAWRGAQTLRSSRSIEGELPEDGLAAYSDDLLLALGRELCSSEPDSDSVESVFKQAERVAAQAEQLLVDED